RAHARLLKMLVWPAADAEPAVVGDVDEPARTLAARYRLTGKDDLVADQRQDARSARYVQRAPSLARNEAADHLGQLAQAQMLEPILERQVFAKRYQMHLVVDRQDGAVVVDHIDGIIGASRLTARRRRLGRTHRAGDQHGTLRQQGRD